MKIMFHESLDKVQPSVASQNLAAVESQEASVQQALAALRQSYEKDAERLANIEKDIKETREDLEQARVDKETAMHQLSMAKDIILKSDEGDLFAEAISPAPDSTPRMKRKAPEGGSPAQTPPHSPSTPRTPVVHSSLTDGPIRMRRHVFEAHVSRLPAISAQRCTVCSKSISFGSRTIKCTQCSRIFHTLCMGGVPHDCRPPPFGTDLAKRRKLPPFGQNLLKSIDAFSVSGRVPAIVEECVAALDRRGLSVEGIYSVPVDEDEVREIRDRFFDGGKRVNVMTVANIHVVASVLLTFLRNLDEPLLTLPLYSRFLAEGERASGPFSQPLAGTDVDSPAQRLRALLVSLPPVNFHVVMSVILHLQRCVQ